MNTRHVFEFTQIAQHESFSAAAGELFVSQSTLSKHIRSLEESLGVALFDRTTRKVRLTPEGTTFLAFAKSLCEIEKNALNALKEFKRDSRKKLSIGNLPMMGFYGILADIQKFQKLYPEIEVEIIEYNGNSMIEALIDGDFELAFYDDSLAKNVPGIENLHYCDDYLTAIVHKDHPLAKETTIATRLLEKERLLFFDKTTPIYDKSYNLCKEAGFTPNIYFSGVRIENILELVSLNMGIALVMKKYTQHSKIDNVVVKEIYPTATRSIVLGYIKKRKLSHRASVFRNYISLLS